MRTRYSILFFFPRRLPWAVYFALLEATHALWPSLCGSFLLGPGIFPLCPFKLSSDVSELLRPRYCTVSSGSHTQTFGNDSFIHIPFLNYLILSRSCHFCHNMLLTHCHFPIYMAELSTFCHPDPKFYHHLSTLVSATSNQLLIPTKVTSTYSYLNFPLTRSHWLVP